MKLLGARFRSLSLLCAIALAGIGTAPAGAQAESPPAPIAEVMQLVRSGDFAGAIERLEALHDAGDASSQELAMLGGLYVETKQPGRALEILTPLAEAEDADPAVLYNAGRAAASLGQITDADLYLRRSLAKEPKSPARRRLGFLYGAHGVDEEAFVLLRSWALDNPSDVEARVAAAALAVRLVRVPDAELLLSDLPQDRPGIRLLWGEVTLLKGDPWGAISYLKPLLSEAPAGIEMDVRRSLAKAYLAVGESASAVEVLAGKVGGDAQLALQLASAYYQGGDLDKALATLEPMAAPLLDAEAPQADPANIDLIREYGRLLVTAGRHQEAIPYLRLATQADPDSKEAWQGLGQALAAAGDRDEATAALTRFQELSRQHQPESADQIERDLVDPTGAAMRKALETYRTGDSEKALAMIRREAELAPEDPRPLLLASRLLLLEKDTEAALGAAERAVDLAPENADAHYQRGTVLLALRQVEDAEKELRRALELAPDHTAAMSDLAVLLANTGHRDEAETLLERVLELRPDDPVATKNLEQLRAKKNS